MPRQRPEGHCKNNGFGEFRETLTNSVKHHLIPWLHANSLLPIHRMILINGKQDADFDRGMRSIT